MLSVWCATQDDTHCFQYYPELMTHIFCLQAFLVIMKIGPLPGRKLFLCACFTQDLRKVAKTSFCRLTLTLDHFICTHWCFLAFELITDSENGGVNWWISLCIGTTGKTGARHFCYCNPHISSLTVWDLNASKTFLIIVKLCLEVSGFTSLWSQSQTSSLL